MTTLLHKTKIPAVIKVSIISLLILSLFAQYFLPILASLAVLYLLFVLFWEEGHPPIILFGLGFMWVSISLGYFYVAFFQGEFRDLLWYPYYSLDNIERAFWYSIVGLASLAVGIKIGIGKQWNKRIELPEVESLDPIKLMLFYFVYAFVVDYLFNRIRFLIPGVSEFFHMLKFFKWSILFLITINVFHTQKHIGLYWLFVATAIVLSFTSFFADFKPYFFVIPIGYLTIRQLTPKQTIYITILGVFVFVLGVYWSYIKEDYRLFLSGGTMGQKVVVSRTEALKKFFSYAKYFDRLRFKYGEEALLKRIFYLEFFSATIRNIPTYRPYMQGENIMRAVRHVTMPRILFPNKPPLDDSKHTTELTGIYVSGAKQGVSISVGFFSEIYADFGPFGMNIALLLLGTFIGLIYKMTLKITPSNMWAFAMAIPVFFFVSSFEKDLVKLVGNLLWFVITYFTIRYTILRPMIKFFYKKSST